MQVKHKTLPTLPLKIVGGKYRKRQFYIAELFKLMNDNIVEYREPFAGSAAVGFELMRYNSNIEHMWLNDIDPLTANLWRVIKDYPDLFKEYIKLETISEERYDAFLERVKNCSNIPYCDLDQLEFALYKLIVNKLSYSGYGAMGSKCVSNFSKRYHTKNLCKSVQLINARMNDFTVRISNLDFEQVIRDTTYPALIYLDPVYYDKGNALYQYGMTDTDHERLSYLLLNTKHNWLLSYDDAPFIRKLYKSAKVRVINYGEYTNRVRGVTANELLITRY